MKGEKPEAAWKAALRKTALGNKSWDRRCKNRTLEDALRNSFVPQDKSGASRVRHAA
jgi:hypothetical protein